MNFQVLKDDDIVLDSDRFSFHPVNHDIGFTLAIECQTLSGLSAKTTKRIFPQCRFIYRGKEVVKIEDFLPEGYKRIHRGHKVDNDTVYTIKNDFINNPEKHKKLINWAKYHTDYNDSTMQESHERNYIFLVKIK